MSGGIKIVLLVVGVNPWSRILFVRGTTLRSPVGILTIGDVLMVLTMLFSAMLIFELLYRDKVSPISVAHHTGAIIIGQTAVVLGLDLPRNPDATLEFNMCLIWGESKFPSSI